jgi:hypothetical protein
LSPADIKARLRNIRDNLKKKSLQVQSKYDFEELLQARMEASEDYLRVIEEVKASG